jgi:hypothetical protein
MCAESCALLIVPCVLGGQLVFLIFLDCDRTKAARTSFNIVLLTGRLPEVDPLQIQKVSLNNIMPLVEDFSGGSHQSAYEISFAQ